MNTHEQLRAPAGTHERTQAQPNTTENVLQTMNQQAYTQAYQSISEQMRKQEYTLNIDTGKKQYIAQGLTN